MYHNIYQYLDIADANQRATRHVGAPVKSKTSRLPVGEMVEAHRVQHKLTVTELARRVKMHPQTIASFECFDDEPDVCAMHILCSELNIKLT